MKLLRLSHGMLWRRTGSTCWVRFDIGHWTMFGPYKITTAKKENSCLIDKLTSLTSAVAHSFQSITADPHRRFGYCGSSTPISLSLTSKFLSRYSPLLALFSAIVLCVLITQQRNKKHLVRVHSTDGISWDE